MTLGDGFLHPDRLFPADPAIRPQARALYEEVRDLPIVSPHGHTEPSWFAEDASFGDAATLLVIPDHYLFRMLNSVGISHDELGLPLPGAGPLKPPREIWRIFSTHYARLFRGTPSSLWVEHALSAVLGVAERPSAENADRLFDQINERLAEPEFRPRALFERFRIETIATTDGALDSLSHHEKMAQDGWIGRVRATYRPDAVTDPEAAGFAGNLRRLGDLTETDVAEWPGMIEAHRRRRAFFRRYGATATDHGAPSPLTLDLTPPEKQRLLTGALAGALTPEEAEAFRAQMLTEMAGLSVEDGMVMQLHAGSFRNTDPGVLAARGLNMGADIPRRADWTTGLQALLSRYGSAPGFRLILFTLDESVYARELAPMAGHWPSLLIGPPWWFHDSPNGIRRYLDQVVETAGFANLAGFNDDTRAFLSIPARHDVWRREVCAFLARMTAEHRLDLSDARELAADLSYGLAKRAYRL